MTDRIQRAFRLLRSTVDDARAAVHHLKGVDGAPQSLDAFMDTAAQRYHVDLRKRHNGGQPFPPAPDRLSQAAPPDVAARAAAAARKAKAAKRAVSDDDK